jgi:glycerol-3-phosphate dehydrogenase (NAD(P)+)
MSIVTIVGSGMMGTALCWPLRENGHTVRLVGTPLDEDIITSIRSTGIHPRLQRKVPAGVEAYPIQALAQALRGANLVVSGVSSFGVDWFARTVGPLLLPDVPVLCVTKGLVDLPDGDLQILPEAIRAQLPAALRGKLSINAIGGPCTAHELAAKRQTGGGILRKRRRHPVVSARLL